MDVTQRISLFGKYTYLDIVGDCMTTMNDGSGIGPRGFEYNNHSIFAGIKITLGQM
ncbi:hypothetical protein [Cohaesibacter gelatinilyticus]|uniref:hypothetical protein n=1 Tax=Cohaesibacter gelatinilyticus TaxID=372072 RepID=UPI0014831856|nr:hypothetical protein [Cohaesibacter gelatinilyticus]